VKKKTLLLISLLIAFYSYGQTPCVNGFAGEYACSDYDLLSHTPVNILANTSGTPEGSDV